MITRHTTLAERCVQAAGDPTDGAARWAAVLTRIGITDVHTDDYWPVLAGRLTLADTAGVPVPCLLYTSPSPRDGLLSRMPSSA